MDPSSIIVKVILTICEQLPTAIYCYQLTVSTPNPSILRVGTVMNANWIGRAVNKSSFTASAGHVVQEDGSSSLAKESM